MWACDAWPERELRVLKESTATTLRPSEHQAEEEVNQAGADVKLSVFRRLQGRESRGMVSSSEGPIV